MSVATTLAVVSMLLAFPAPAQERDEPPNRVVRVLPSNPQAVQGVVTEEPRFLQAQQRDDDTDTPTLEDLGDPDRPQVDSPAEEPISIDFKDASLMDVIAAIGAQTGRNFDVDPNLASQRVTIIAHHRVPPQLALEVLESILASRNFTMVESLDGNLIKITPSSSPQGDKLEISSGTTPPPGGYDRQSVQVVNVQFADASEVMELLRKVGSATHDITAYSQTNTLIIRDTADGIRNMLKLLEIVDIAGSGTSVEFFTLEYARAEALSQQIQEVLTGGDSGAQQRPGVQRTPAVRRQPRTPVVPGQAAAEVIGQGEEVLRMVSDERLNALIVVATEGNMSQVRFLIKQLDTPTPFESNNMHYVELLNADAEEVVAALTAITGTAPRQGAQQAAQSGEIQPFEKDIVIAEYEQTNALLILATPQDFAILKDLIDKLDVARRQVSVEAIIMEVTINDALSLSVEGVGLTDEGVFGLSNAASLATIMTGGIPLLAGAGGTIGIIDGTVSVPDPLGDGGTVEVPNVPLLMRALETITDVDVLSKPNLLTVDNESARINVGQEIPIISSLADTDDRTGFQSRSQVQRTETGVTLEVTPQIREGDFVSLDISVDVSTPVISSIGIDPNSSGATIAQSVIESQVVIGDGQTGIIGGLIRESVTRSRSQVPFFGDLPLVGWLFRGKSNTRNKQNLVVLLTPHIVKQGADLQRISEDGINEFYDRNIDAIFEKGFIKKIKNKRRQRKGHPSEAYRPVSKDDDG